MEFSKLNNNEKIQLNKIFLESCEQSSEVSTITALIKLGILDHNEELSRNALLKATHKDNINAIKTIHHYNPISINYINTLMGKVYNNQELLEYYMSICGNIQRACVSGDLETLKQVLTPNSYNNEKIAYESCHMRENTNLHDSFIVQLIIWATENKHVETAKWLIENIEL